MELKKLEKCITPNNYAQDLKHFLDTNKHLIFLQIDKTKDLALLDIVDYSFKLNSIFSPDKFTKLSKNPLQNDLLNYRALIYQLKPYLSLTDQRLITPKESLKQGFGILKN